MSHSLAVLSLSESFQQLWQQFATSFRVELRMGGSLPELGSVHTSACAVVSAAGSESSAPDLVRQLRGGHAPPVCVVTADDDYRLAIACLREGADNYFVLPQDTGSLRSWIAENVERARERDQAQDLAAELGRSYDFSNIIGSSAPLLSALETASKVIARCTSTVLITGETGTGKDVLARAIHFNGPRAAKPFIEINCTALPEHLLEAELFGYEAGAFTDARIPKPGLFEAANGGTLFLDEVGDLPTGLQAKLLRVLEDKWIRRLGSVVKQQVDVRIIAATHADLPAGVRDGWFRRDLHYRLNVFPIELPALRERGEDILTLANHFLQQFAAAYDVPRGTLSPAVARVLLMHPWPGNVRELRNSMERAVLLGDGEIRRENLFPPSASAAAPANIPIPFPAPMEEIARAIARSMVNWCGGNKSQAANLLEISRKRLYTLLNGTGGGDA